MPAVLDHPQAKEIEQINHTLEANPTIWDLAIQDFCTGHTRINLTETFCLKGYRFFQSRSADSDDHFSK